MYEPKYLPMLTQKTASLAGIRFGIAHSNKAVRPDDPEADPLHIHHYLEIFFNLSSDVSFLVNGTVYPVMPGDAVVSLPDDIHVCIFRKACVHEHICLWIDADLTSPFFSFLRKEHFCPLLSFEEETGRALRAQLLTLAQLCAQEGAEVEKTVCFLQILVLLGKDKGEGGTKIYMPQALQKIIREIDGHFAEIHAVGDIPASHYVSPATLTRWFRKYIHASPREYLESRRLSHAVKLLARGATVTEACFQSGFSDCSHFISLFRRKFGKTPLQYKKELQKTED